MQTETTQLQKHVLVIRGQLAGPSFIPWIERHSRRLGLRSRHTYAGPERIELEVQGLPEFIDALEVGCLLGPIDVWVDSIDRVTDPASTRLKNERNAQKTINTFADRDLGT